MYGTWSSILKLINDIFIVDFFCHFDVDHGLGILDLANFLAILILVCFTLDLSDSYLCLLVDLGQIYLRWLNFSFFSFFQTLVINAHKAFMMSLCLVTTEISKVDDTILGF